ncbi:MAG: RNA methyltransferase [Bacilli bacterium]|nr:RNA methyltransferase [Bacilli bacterium]
MEINSINNDRVKNWVKLNNKKYRDESNTYLVEGDHLVNEAIKNGVAKEIITLKEINSDIPEFIVTEEIMKKISNQVTISDIACVCNKQVEKDAFGKVLILDSLQDPGNLGTIIRSAVAFNFDTIILGNNTVDLYNDKVIRSSEGMIFNINIIKRDLSKIIPELKLKGYTIFGTDVDNGVEADILTKYENIAIVIGNEGNGMSAMVKDMCDEFINIPINDKCESLNAAVAASILMYVGR